MRSLRLVSVLIAALGCGGELVASDPFGDAGHATRSLEGAELGAELSTSPAQEAPLPFVRLGVLWDAPATSRLEISTSADGTSFSEWRAVEVRDMEVEAATSFVGEHVVQGAPARFYRLRASGAERPTFVSLEFLTEPLERVMEDGAPPQKESAEHEGIGARALGLTIGPATVNGRAAWGARPPRCVSNHSPNRITIHHTVTPTNDSMSPEARLRQIQSYHMNVQGWCDIGYHFLVSRDGRLWEGRPARQLGTHVANNNTGNLGISFMGTHTDMGATSEQLAQVGRLMRGLGAAFGIRIDGTRVKGHRDYNSTACPGNALYAQIPALIARAQADPPPPPPPALVTVKGIIYEGSDTARRVASATVTLGDLGATSNAAGYYEIRNVRPGSYTITAEKAGYLRSSISRVVSGSETWASIGLSPLPMGNASLIGVVYHGASSQNRVPGASIVLSTGHRASCDGDGLYRLGGLPPGPVEITASKPGYAPRSVSRVLVGGGTVWGSVGL